MIILTLLACDLGFDSGVNEDLPNQNPLAPHSQSPALGIIFSNSGDIEKISIDNGAFDQSRYTPTTPECAENPIDANLIFFDSKSGFWVGKPKINDNLLNTNSFHFIVNPNTNTEGANFLVQVIQLPTHHNGILKDYPMIVSVYQPTPDGVDLITQDDTHYLRFYASSFSFGTTNLADLQSRFPLTEVALQQNLASLKLYIFADENGAAQVCQER